MKSIYIEQQFCEKCYCVHWLEFTPINREICHGEDWNPITNPPANTHTRRSGRGFEILPNLHAPIQEELLPVGWQMRLQAEEF